MKYVLITLIMLLALWFAYWCGSLAAYENPEIAGDVIWLQYCARNWLKEVPVSVSLNGETWTVLVYIDHAVLASRTDPQIPEGAGVGWNDRWCWQGNANPIWCGSEEEEIVKSGPKPILVCWTMMSWSS